MSIGGHYYKYADNVMSCAVFVQDSWPSKQKSRLYIRFWP